MRWGVGGAIAQKFAQEGFFTVVTTRSEKNAAPLAAAIREQGGDAMIVELDLVSQDSIAAAFATIRREAGDPEVLVYNAGSDVLATDPLASLRLTPGEMAERDLYVVTAVREQGIPLALVLSGGYGPKSWEAHARSLEGILVRFDKQV